MQFIRSQTICNRCRHKIHQLSFLRWYSNGRKKLSSKDVRSRFLDFFCNRNDHKFVRSSSVIPAKDQGTYFTNAGMNQFKPIFLGTVPADSDMAEYKRVTNSQKCVRVGGGKHNDLDEVGNDTTHHTFFEMLGSWSFGDYFKKEPCRMALELLTDVYKLPRDRLYFTYFGGDPNLGLQADDECRTIWQELGVPNERILALGSNFWDMGQVGPCGPCTEIHYDHLGDRDASHLVDRGYPDVVEIWNLVFIHYNRQNDQSLTPTSSRHVDTGMGLERISAVLQGTMSNYDTDLFLPIFHAITREVGAVTCGEEARARAYMIIADHVRMATVCISDGLMPGRDDLSHKLRSVIYRSLYQCHNVLGASPGLLAKLVDPVVDTLGDTYPEIGANREKVQEALRQTEERYLVYIKDGRRSFSKFLKHHPNITEVSAEHLKQFQNGKYYRGVSAVVVEQLATEHGLNVDMDEYMAQVQSQSQRAPVSTTNDMQPSLTHEVALSLEARGTPKTDDSQKYIYTRRHSNVTNTGVEYDFRRCTCTVVAILTADGLADSVSAGKSVGLVLDTTQLYAESGGQKADKGQITTQTGNVAVTDVQKGYGYVLHVGTVTDGRITTDQPADLDIDLKHRLGCMFNHTATHLVNAALRQTLGDVNQRGSSVDSDKFTFDFQCLSQIDMKDIAAVETMVRDTIDSCANVSRRCMPLKDARKLPGLVILENEVYQNNVFVIAVDGAADQETLLCHSVELCGGTHVLNVGDIGSFCVSNLSGLAHGTKRITCLTGENATRAMNKGRELTAIYWQLEQAVHNKRDKGQWNTWKNRISAILSDHQSLPPKLVRDVVGPQFWRLMVDITAQQNRTAGDQFVQEIHEAMADDDLYVLKRLKAKSLKRAAKLLASLEVSKMTIVVVQSTKSNAAFIFVPKSCELEMAEVGRKVAIAMNGVLEARTDISCVVITHDRSLNVWEETRQCLQTFSL